MRTLITIIILTLPTLFEVYRDRNGDIHPNNDWVLRGITCIIVGLFISLTMHSTSDHFSFIFNLVRFSTSSAFLFAALFPYWINFVHLKNGITVCDGIQYKFLKWYHVFDHIMTHLSDSAWPDKKKWWRALGWLGRYIVYLVFLFVGVWLIVL